VNAEPHYKRSTLLPSRTCAAKRIKQWTFYKRDETSIKKKVKQMIVNTLDGKTSVPKNNDSAGSGKYWKE